MKLKTPPPDIKHPQIALVGQPNCGKSTIFNMVAGYRSISTNFPGVTVTYTTSHVNIKGQTFDLIDLPGAYSITSLDTAARETKKFLLAQKGDTIIDVIDASILSRSLELTLQLLELEIPVVVCLNMMDEAARKGVSIDSSELERILKVPVIETIGYKGVGIDLLFQTAFLIAEKKKCGEPIKYSRPVEKTVAELGKFLAEKVRRFPHSPRLVAIKLLEKDDSFEKIMHPIPAKAAQKIESCEAQLRRVYGESADAVISAERHAMAMNLFERVASVGQPRKSWKDSIDDLLMHPFWGYVLMAIFLFAFFNIVFRFGAAMEGPLLAGLNSISHRISDAVSPQSVLGQILLGSFKGVAGGTAIVLPYLFPFLLGMAFIEDLGYLPRVAYLMDSLMHRIGLHGSAVVPAMLGYGCSVPAVMATRILSSPRDRFIVSALAVLIPCSARMSIIMGLAGYYLGGTAAMGIYILNISVVGLSGAILSRLLPEDIPGMLMEMPSYQMPVLSNLLAKTWLRLKDFIIIAWPLLIVGSLVLGLAEWYQIDEAINAILRPLTYALGLPAGVGTTLIFGILRKELSLLMLFQALGTTDISTVMSNGQIFVFTIFIVFYIPCLATIGVLAREIGWRGTLKVTVLTIGVASILALAARLILSLFS